MKGFFNMFGDSAKSFKDIRALATTGMLLAMAIAIKINPLLSIDVTADLRISFAFIPICVIGMLYGPVMCGASSFLVDFLGYMIANKSPRAYSPQLALVVILSGIIYGCFLYKCKYDTKKDSAISTLRILGGFLSVAVICNICLNSYLLYTLYVNKDFTLTDRSGWEAFGLYCSPRIVKNLIEFPIRTLILSLLLPVIKAAYDKVRLQFGHKKTQKV